MWGEGAGIATLVIVLAAVLMPLSVHRIDEGNVGVYFRVC